MLTGDDWDHVATIRVDAAADDAFAYMKDTRNISEWALGALYPVEVTPETYVGDSMVDGQRVFIKVENDPQQKHIHFRTGPGWDRLEQQILCRIVKGDDANGGEGSSVLSLSAHRAAAMPLPRWQQLCASHEVEMFILKNRIETKRQERDRQILSCHLEHNG
jgi:hypothetical protein